MTIPIAAEDWQSDDTAALVDAFTSLESDEETAAFLRDLCTLRELEEMTQRWAVVRRLVVGQSYRDISDATGVSTTTITRINQWLQHGTGGYRAALRHLGLMGDDDE